jgi:hypothetical protein
LYYWSLTKFDVKKIGFFLNSYLHGNRCHKCYWHFSHQTFITTTRTGFLNEKNQTNQSQDGPWNPRIQRQTPGITTERDFNVKTRNTKVSETFQICWPGCFIDNHVSNGADYQYKITYISDPANQTWNCNKMVTKWCLARLTWLENKRILKSRLMNAFNETPDGFAQFWQSKIIYRIHFLFNTIDGSGKHICCKKKYKQIEESNYEYGCWLQWITQTLISRNKRTWLQTNHNMQLGNRTPSNGKLTQVTPFSLLGWRPDIKKRKLAK